MKKILYTIIAVLAIATGCQKESGFNKIVGDWHYTGEESGVKEDVWLTFNDDDTFVMYQKVGDGPYWYSTGDYAVDAEDKVLTGVYSDRYPWKYSYKVDVDSNTLKMTAVEVEGYSVSYKRESVPAEVRAKSLPLTKSETAEAPRFL